VRLTNYDDDGRENEGTKSTKDHDDDDDDLKPQINTDERGFIPRGSRRKHEARRTTKTTEIAMKDTKGTKSDFDLRFRIWDLRFQI
jgi:hypothetical protein